MSFETRNSNGDTRGFTLLEVLLALGLSILVLAAIGTAIHTHLTMVDMGRARVEEAQLARAVLTRIADDLHAGIQYQKPDLTGLSVISSSGQGARGGRAAGGGGSGGGGSGGTGGGGGAGGQQSGETGSPATAATPTSGRAAGTSVAESAAPTILPGLYGYQYELQIDVSRLPRLDEYMGATARDGATTTLVPPTDVKTVAYYLREPNGDVPGGLVRREVDRAATLWASEQGDTSGLDAKAEVLAPEVTSLEFVYYDATTTYTEWDSTAMGALPLAVEIILTLAGPASETSTSGIEVEQTVYRLLVHLPAAQGAAPASTTATSTTSSTSTTSASSTATDSSSTTGQ